MAEAQTWEEPTDAYHAAQGKQLCLLTLDGGGVRGLSSLQILKQLMELIDPENPPKPCDYFDMIGGTSTGGLIAIMLGRLQMDVQECIDEYKRLSSKVFTHTKSALSWKGKFRGRFDHDALEKGVKALLASRGESEDALLRDPQDHRGCKTFVCTTSESTNDQVLLTSYYAKRWGKRLYDTVRIWEAARATSAATSFFDPITINEQRFVDGATNANNPVNAIWIEAYNHWRDSKDPAWRLEDNIQCLVSIGTGKPSLEPFGKSLIEVGKTLLAISTETEKEAEKFQRSHDTLFNTRRAFRFNVAQGLEKIGLEDSQRVGDILSATDRYIAIQDVQESMDACANNLKTRELWQQLEELVQKHLLLPTQEYFDRQQYTGKSDVQTYINTDVVQSLWDQDEPLIWCATDPGSHKGLAAGLTRTFSKSGTHKALYYSFSKAGSSEGSTYDPQRSSSHVLDNIFSSLICQLVTQWPDDRRLSHMLQSMDPATLCMIRSSLENSDGLEGKTTVLQKLALHSGKPIVLFIESIDRLSQSDLQAIITQLKKQEMTTRKGLGIILVGNYSEWTMKYLGDFRRVDSLSEYRDCVKSLVFDECNIRKGQVENATPGTNKWIWTHPAYQAFFSEPASLLWIEGKAGSGKSVLAKSIVSQLQKQSDLGNGSPSQSRDRLLISDWFYHRRGGSRYMSHSGFIRSMALCFLQQDPRMLCHFLGAYRKADSLPMPGTSVKTPSSFPWTAELLKSVVRDIVESGVCLIVIADALDEAEDVTILSWILDLLKSHPGTFIKFIILSRPSPRIEEYLRRSHRVRLETENEDDIRMVVDEGLTQARAALHWDDFEAHSPTSDRESSDEPDRTITNVPTTSPKVESLFYDEGMVMDGLRKFILENARSTMLWVRLVLQDINNQFEDGFVHYVEIFESVKRLPPGLEEYYMQMVHELPRSKTGFKEDLKFTREILMLVSGISEIRALTLEELWEAISFEMPDEDAPKGAAQGKAWDTKRFVRLPTYDVLRRRLQRLCGPFLEFLKPFEQNGLVNDTRPQAQTVQLMHQTINDFLQNADLSGSLHFTPTEASAFVKKLSLAYKENALGRFREFCKEADANPMSWPCAVPTRLASIDAAKAVTNEQQTVTPVLGRMENNVNGLLEWFEEKALLPCASEIVSGKEDLSDFYPSTFGEDRLFDQDILFSEAARLGQITAMRNLVLISRAVPWYLLDQGRRITHGIILTAAESRISAFKFDCLETITYDRDSWDEENDGIDYTREPWTTATGFGLKVSYGPDFNFSVQFRGWNYLLSETCGSYGRFTSRPMVKKQGQAEQSKPANPADVEKAIVLAMKACRDNRMAANNFWSHYQDRRGLDEELVIAVKAFWETWATRQGLWSWETMPEAIRLAIAADLEWHAPPSRREGVRSFPSFSNAARRGFFLNSKQHRRRLGAEGVLSWEAMSEIFQDAVATNAGQSLRILRRGHDKEGVMESSVKLERRRPATSTADADSFQREPQLISLGSVYRYCSAIWQSIWNA